MSVRLCFTTKELQVNQEHFYVYKRIILSSIILSKKFVSSYFFIKYWK